MTSGCQQTLAVYAYGSLPHTFQWYEGIDGDLTNSILIPGATSHVYTTPALTGDKSYWLKIKQGSEHKDSQTIKLKVYATNSTHFSGSLDLNQTWNLTSTLCNPSGTFVHYSSTRITMEMARRTSQCGARALATGSSKSRTAQPAHRTGDKAEINLRQQLISLNQRAGRGASIA